MEALAKALDAQALKQLEDFEARRAAGVKDAEYYKHADIALRFISNAVKLHGTLENREANVLRRELLRMKLVEVVPTTAPALPGGNPDAAQ